MTSATRVKPAILIALAACVVSYARMERTDRQDHVGRVEEGQNDEADAMVVQHIRARNLRRQLVRRVSRRTRLSVTKWCVVIWRWSRRRRSRPSTTS